jgi:hypothetical protein
MSSEDLLNVLIETKVLTALHTAEAVKAKLLVIAGLYERIKKGEWENTLRDYIAHDPWLISPQWETFKKEIAVNNLLEDAANTAQLDKYEAWHKRIDLALRGGDTLVIAEFMKPGTTIDRDHLTRFAVYVDAARVLIEANTALPYKHCIGYLIADRLEKSPFTLKELKRLEASEMYAYDWKSLLHQAAALWEDFFGVLVDRSPEDERLIALAEHLKIELPTRFNHVDSSNLKSE